MVDPLWRLMIVVLLIMAEALATCMENSLKKANESFFEKKVEEEQDKKAQIVLKLLEKEKMLIVYLLKVHQNECEQASKYLLLIHLLQV